MTKNINFKRNAFNLFITISSLPFDLKIVEKIYDINLVIELTKKEFVCLFGQSWCCYEMPYLWIYNEDKLLCNLKNFWSKKNNNYKNLTQQFLEQFKIENIIPNIDLLLKSFLSNYDGILYQYFVKNVFSDIAYFIDLDINREDYKKQLFYYDKCSDTFPNLSSNYSILLNGLLTIFNRKISISLQYKIIDNE